ncbi:MAG: 30S ribosomal protein S17 [Chloroflexi bacterium]|nr:30S ribosomal protein S17 [Chloroflexota bacterium]
MVRGRRKTRVGRVISGKMDKTVVVAVEWSQTHPIYNKAVKQVTKFYAHDEGNECKVGDVVNIVETRPLSKTKRWRVTQVLSTGDIPTGDAALGLAPVEMGNLEVTESKDQGGQEKEA